MRSGRWPVWCSASSSRLPPTCRSPPRSGSCSARLWDGCRVAAAREEASGGGAGFQVLLEAREAPVEVPLCAPRDHRLKQTQHAARAARDRELHQRSAALRAQPVSHRGWERPRRALDRLPGGRLVLDDPPGEDATETLLVNTRPSGPLAPEREVRGQDRVEPPVPVHVEEVVLHDHDAASVIGRERPGVRAGHRPLVAVDAPPAG